MENPSGLDTISNILKKEIENAKIAAAKGLPEKAALRAMNGAAEAARNEGRQRIALQINNGDLVAYLPDALGKFNAIHSEHDLMQQLRSFLSDGVKTKPDYTYNEFTRSDVVSGRHTENMEWLSRMYIPVGTPKQNSKLSEFGTHQQDGRHTTAELEILKEAIAEFWENHDPAAPPKSEIVVSWLKEKGVSLRIAEAMDTIMRTSEARKGGNKKRNG